MIVQINNLFLSLKRPLLALFLLVVVQFLCAAGGLAISAISNNINVNEAIMNFATDTQTLCISSLLSNVFITCICLYLFNRNNYNNWKSPFRKTSIIRNSIALLTCFIGTFALDLMSELLALPNIMELQIIKMCQHPLGIAAISIGAPIGEEIVFRWGIMGHLLQKGNSPFIAILISALLFGLIHANPIQIFFASAMGMMLGLLYWRSGSIMLPILLHCVNNSLACLQVSLLGNKVRDFSLVETFGGYSIAWCLALTCSLLCSGILWWYSTDRKHNTPTTT
jgi:membrane protease YdiL (CAAX protease family)